MFFFISLDTRRIMASARGSSKESSFGIDYERMEESDSSSFSDPFAAPAEDYGDVMMSRADYGLKESSGSSDSYLDSSPSPSPSSSSSSSGSRLDVGHLSSALGASSLPFGAGLAQKRERPAEAATTWGNERRGVWGAASYNIGALAAAAPSLRARAAPTRSPLCPPLCPPPSPLPSRRLLVLWRARGGRRAGRGLWPALLPHAQPAHRL